MAYAYDKDDNLIAEVQAASLLEAFQEIIEKAPEAKKIIVKELSLEERLEILEAKVELLIFKGVKIK